MAGNAYLAVAAKVRAMYGGRMTGEDYRQLMGKTTIPQAAAFLQSHRGYRRELAGLHPEGLHREQLENALRTTYRNEYHRIFSFLSLQDQALMRFPIYQAEKEAILTSMRRLSSRHMLEPEAQPSGSSGPESGGDLPADCGCRSGHHLRLRHGPKRRLRIPAHHGLRRQHPAGDLLRPFI